MRSAWTRCSTWLLVVWSAVIAAFLLLQAHRTPLCLLGWFRCGTQGMPSSRWITPSRGHILFVWIVGVLILSLLWWWEGRRDKRDVELHPRRVRPGILIAIGVAGALAAAH